MTDAIIRVGIIQLLGDMWDVLDQRNGWGLAAPQLGAPVRVMITHVRERGNNACKIEVINPTLIIKKKKGRFLSDEGCLSYPGRRVSIQRWNQVQIKGLNRHGEAVTYGGKHNQAAALQHEYEHLDGINIADYA